jgi:hypothetical protein
MTTSAWLITAFLVFFTATLGFVAVVVWRTTPGRFNEMDKQMRRTSPFNGDVARGSLRGFATFPVAGVFLTAMQVLTSMSAHRKSVGGGSTERLDSLAFDALIAGLVFFVLHVVVIWFNWPRWFSPAHLRHEQGVWAARRTSKGRGLARRR